MDTASCRRSTTIGVKGVPLGTARTSASATRRPPAVRSSDSTTGAHLVEQQFLWNPTEPVEGTLQRFHQDRHRLPRIEVQPQQPRVAQHDHQGMTPPPGKRERPDVHLALAPRRRLEPHHRFNRLARPCCADVLLHALVTARVPQLADLAYQAHRAERGVSGQPVAKILPVTERTHRRSARSCQFAPTGPKRRQTIGKTCIRFDDGIG